VAIKATVNVSGSFLDEADTSGTTAADVSLAYIDTTSQKKAESDKKITLSSTQIFSPTGLAPGKAIFLTGTCDTSGVTLDAAASGYAAADGSTVAITNVTLIAFAANPKANLESTGLNGLKMASQDDGVAISYVPMAVGVGNKQITIKTVGGFGDGNLTATYSVVVYGSS